MFDSSIIPTLHNGLISATAEQVRRLMPKVANLIESEDAPAIFSAVPYRFDVKVHMLMPGQYPCIPGWHQDFVPRDDDKTLRSDLISPGAPPMFLWISGEPRTEFRPANGPVFSIPAESWFPFTQYDVHRGTVATEHGWRLLIRAAPESIVPPHALELSGLRRHSQVYLNADDFAW